MHAKRMYLQQGNNTLTKQVLKQIQGCWRYHSCIPSESNQAKSEVNWANRCLYNRWHTFPCLYLPNRKSWAVL